MAQYSNTAGIISKFRVVLVGQNGYRIDMNKHYPIVEKALLYLLKNRQVQPSLKQLAAHCHLSEYHFQRVFSQWAGVSPKQFLQCLNRDYARQCLLQGHSLQATTLDTGLSSPARLHDLFVTLEAITPGQIKSAGENMQFTCGIHSTPFGDCFIANTERGIHQLAFIEEDAGSSHWQSLAQQWPAARFVENPSLTQSIIDRIFSPATNSGASFKLWVKGSAFQFKVWEALLAIPEGKLACYSSIAAAIDQPNAARAVGSAVAKNSVAYLIPCHRVIKAIGVSGNYRWGEARKQAIIGRELSSHTA